MNYCEICSERGEQSYAVTRCDMCSRWVCYLHHGNKFESSSVQRCVDCQLKRS